MISETNQMVMMRISPLHGFGEPEGQAAVMMAHKAFGCFMGLLEYDRHEEIAVLLGQLGATMREKGPPEDSDESMPAEVNSESSALCRLWPVGGVRS